MITINICCVGVDGSRQSHGLISGLLVCYVKHAVQLWICSTHILQAMCCPYCLWTDIVFVITVHGLESYLARRKRYDRKKSIPCAVRISTYLDCKATKQKILGSGSHEYVNALEEILTKSDHLSSLD